MKLIDSWRSERLGREITVVRWGAVGKPFLIFPTAGGDAEEIERFLVIQTLADHLEAGRIKIYSCDAAASRALFVGEGSPEHRMRLMNQFFEFVGHELVPAIRADCDGEELEMFVAGSSIGAFTALESICRFPDVFSHALCMSGTFDLGRFVKAPLNQDFYRSSPVHYLPELEGPRLDRLRERFVLLASGEGEAEDIGESWRAADALGKKGVPNRVDSWGPDWKHDWPLWRNMLHKYTPELLGLEGEEG